MYRKLPRCCIKCYYIVSCILWVLDLKVRATLSEDRIWPFNHLFSPPLPNPQNNAFLLAPWAFLIAQLLKNPPAKAGDPGSIPGSGKSAGEEIGYPLQYSWASLVAQLVKNPPAMQETWVRSLGWEDLLEKGKATHSIIFSWRIPWAVYIHGIP